MVIVLPMLSLSLNRTVPTVTSNVFSLNLKSLRLISKKSLQLMNLMTYSDPKGSKNAGFSSCKKKKAILMMSNCFKKKKRSKFLQQSIYQYNFLITKRKNSGRIILLITLVSVLI